jgi:hypothetical protein
MNVPERAPSRPEIEVAAKAMRRRFVSSHAGSVILDPQRVSG